LDYDLPQAHRIQGEIFFLPSSSWPIGEGQCTGNSKKLVDKNGGPKVSFYRELDLKSGMKREKISETMKPRLGYVRG